MKNKKNKTLNVNKKYNNKGIEYNLTVWDWICESSGEMEISDLRNYILEHVFFIVLVLYLRLVI
jgi:hypothetical protein